MVRDCDIASLAGARKELSSCRIKVDGKVEDHISLLPSTKWPNDSKKVWLHETQGVHGEFIVNEVDCST